MASHEGERPPAGPSSPDEFTEHVQWAASHRREVRERAEAVRELVLRDHAMPAAVEPWRVAFADALRASTSRDLLGGAC